MQATATQMSAPCLTACRWGFSRVVRGRWPFLEGKRMFALLLIDVIHSAISSLFRSLIFSLNVYLRARRGAFLATSSFRTE